jgi:CRP-like cAMP-binding protein
MNWKPFFDDLEPEQLERLAPLFAPVSITAGEKIFAQGDPAERLYVVERGAVALRLAPEDGGLVTIGVIHPGGIFGWSAALGRRRYTSAALCIQDGLALAIRGSDLRRAFQHDRALGRRLLGRMALDMAGRDYGAGRDTLAHHVGHLIQAEMGRATA